MTDLFIRDCLLLREKSPIIHNITNYVAMNFSANALLACGASPIMSFCPEEMTDIASMSDAVVINLGCLDRELVKAARIAAATALQAGKPWVLDPVGAGASTLRTDTALDLALHYNPSVIRANASEVTSMAAALGLCPLPDISGEGLISRGIDSSIESAKAIGAAQQLALRTGAVISMSGKVDCITDGQQTVTISNGDAMMSRVTAMGCAASAITAAFAAIAAPLQAAVHAMALMGVCGEIAARGCAGTGSFAVRFIDVLGSFDPAEVSSRIRH